MEEVVEIEEVEEIVLNEEQDKEFTNGKGEE